MKSQSNDETVTGDDRCSACPEEGEEGVIKLLTGYDLYLMHKRLVDLEAELG